MGHEDWVFSAAWQPHQQHPDALSQVPCLLTASMDRTMMLWRPEPSAGALSAPDILLSLCCLSATLLQYYDGPADTETGLGLCGRKFWAIVGKCLWVAGLWMCEESVGDAGASSLGYYGGCFSPEGRSIVAHGFTGALHLWRREGPQLPTSPRTLLTTSPFGSLLDLQPPLLTVAIL